MHKPGYLTTEHAITWVVVGLSAISTFRATGSIEKTAGVIASAVASGAYAVSRGKAKGAGGAGPLDEAQVRRILTDLFRGRINR